MRKLNIAIVFAAATLAAPAIAQQPPGEGIISIYRAAPGHQTQLLQWLARQDEIGKAAGLPPGQLYVHQNGSSWDYLLITKATTDEEDKASDAAARKMGAPTGPKAGIELRQHIGEHSDTLVAGPMTAAEALRKIAE